MGSVVTITLLGVPMGKGRPRFVRATGRIHTDSKTEKYEERLRNQAIYAMSTGGHKRLEGAIELAVLAYLPIPASWSTPKRLAAAQGRTLPTSKPDWDNIAKMIDALKGVVWKDDAQVTDALVRKRYATNPSLFISVRQMTWEDVVRA